MYPETDILPFLFDDKLIDNIRENLPETFDERVTRFVSRYELKREEAERIVYESPELFEKVSKHLDIKPSIFIKTLDLSKNLEREEGYITEDEALYILFEKVSNGIIAKEGIEEVLKRVSKGEDIHKVLSEYSSITNNFDIEAAIDKIISDKREFIIEKGDRAISPIMGICMKEFRGKVDGSIINKILKEKINKVLKSSK